jgi:hypothetical protein
MLFKGLEDTGNIKDTEFTVVVSFYATHILYIEAQEGNAIKPCPSSG